MVMQLRSSGPARTIRPGDLLSDGGVNFRETAEQHNTVGALVGCCDVTAPVYIGWSVPWMCSTLISFPVSSDSRHSAVIFGPSNAVREKYIDIHRELLGLGSTRLGSVIRNVRDRTIELQSGTRIVFVYLEDDADRMRGYHFDSVWVVGEGYAHRPFPRVNDNQQRVESVDRALTVSEEAIRRAEAETERRRLEAIRDVNSRVGNQVLRDSMIGVAAAPTARSPEERVREMMQLVSEGLISAETLRGVLGLEVVADPPVEARVVIAEVEPITFPEKRKFLTEEE